MEYQPVDPAEVQRDYPQVAWFVEFWRALAQEDEGFSVTVGQIAALYDQSVRIGRYPIEVAEDLGLPIPLSMQD